MPEYLLSVHGDSSEEMPEDFDPQPMFEAVERFNTKLREQGHWVYANGLMPSDTATVVDGTGAETVLTDGPYLESKELIGGFWIIDAPDLDVAIALGSRGQRRMPGARRGAPVPGHAGRLSPIMAGRTPEDRSTDVAAVFRSESGRAVATLVRYFGDIDVAEEAVQEAFVVAVERWPVDGVPPSPAGWIITTARRRGSGPGAARVHARSAAGRVGADPRRRRARTTGGGGCGARRPVAPDLHLLPPVAGACVACRADAPARRRAADPGDRPGVPGAGADDGPAARPRQAQDPRRATSRTGCRPTPTCRTACEQCWRCSTWCSTRATCRAPVTRPCATDLCAEAIRLARRLVELMPDEAEARGLLALMLLAESRRPARTDATGTLVLLADQDRSLWDRQLIAEGQEIVRCVSASRPTPDRTRSRRRSPRSTAMRRRRTTPTGPRSCSCTTTCSLLAPSAVVALNRAIAVAELDGPDVALGVGGPARTGRLPPVPRHSRGAARPPRSCRRGRGGPRPGAGAHRQPRRTGAALVPPLRILTSGPTSA